MNKNKFNLRFGIIVLMILVAAASRLLPHPPNFTPIGGMALFGAAYFAKKYWAYLIPFLALWFSDLVLNNVVYTQPSGEFVWISVYALWIFLAFGLIAFLGSTILKKVKPLNLLGASLGASAIFFLVTNFGTWYADPFNMYADNFAGLTTAFAAGLPLFWNTMAGDLVYVGLLFGSFELVKNYYPNLVLQNA